MRNPDKISEKSSITFNFTAGVVSIAAGLLNTFLFLMVWASWGVHPSGIAAYVGLGLVPLGIGIGLLRRSRARKAKFTKRLLRDVVRKIAFRNHGRVKPLDLVRVLGYNSQEALRVLREIAAEDPENVELQLNYDTGEVYFEFQDILKSIEAGKSYEESAGPPPSVVQQIQAGTAPKMAGDAGRVSKKVDDGGKKPESFGRIRVSRLPARSPAKKPLNRLFNRGTGGPHGQKGFMPAEIPGFPPLRPIEFDVVMVDEAGKARDYRCGQAQVFTEDLGEGIRLEMVAIPAGTFWMGSPDGEAGRFSEEGPQHQVVVESFFIGKFEVTQEQWRAVAALPPVHRPLDLDPAKFKGPDRPVERVSWYDCQEFCARLSRKTGRSYRLPTEAEWEYACRAGTVEPFHFGKTVTPDLANYHGGESYGSGPTGEYREETTPVGSFGMANNFGLYDIHGNVWEWCADPWHENYQEAPSDQRVWERDGDASYRVLRGGSWNSHAWYCRSACRDRYQPDVRHASNGFRVAVSLGRAQS